MCVQERTPDDGQRNCPKHVEFYSKNKFEKLVHLVGFIIRIYSNARLPERQIVIYVYKRMYIYAPALEPAAPTVFMVWLRAWLRVRVMRFGGEKNADKNQESIVERLVSFRGNCPF